MSEVVRQFRVVRFERGLVETPGQLDSAWEMGERRIDLTPFDARENTARARMRLFAEVHEGAVERWQVEAQRYEAGGPPPENAEPEPARFVLEVREVVYSEWMTVDA